MEYEYGVVKWFNDVKGFGFIKPNDGSEDVFAHFSAILMKGFRTLKQGTAVRFQRINGPKGKLAQNIHLLSEDETDSVEVNTPSVMGELSPEVPWSLWAGQKVQSGSHSHG